MVTDFSAKDEANGVTFCSAVHRRPKYGISYSGELCFSRSPKSDETASVGHAHPHVNFNTEMCNVIVMLEIREIARRVDVGSACVYTSVPEDGGTCLFNMCCFTLTYDNLW